MKHDQSIQKTGARRVPVFCIFFTAQALARTIENSGRCIDGRAGRLGVILSRQVGSTRHPITSAARTG